MEFEGICECVYVCIYILIYILHLYKFYFLYHSVPNSKVLKAHSSAQRQHSPFPPEIHFAVVCVTFLFSLLINYTSAFIRGVQSVTAATIVAREGTN